MGYYKWMLNFLKKSDYNFGSPCISLRNFHPQLYMTLALQGVFCEDTGSYLRFMYPLSTIAVVILGVVLEILNIYRGLTINDYFLATEAFCYIVIICLIFFIYAGVQINKNKIIKQIHEMEKDFEKICNMGPRYREPFLATQLLIWKLFVCWTFFVTAMTIIFLLSPGFIMLYHNLMGTQEAGIRRLMFPLWLPHDDIYRTPYYQIFLAIQIWGSIAFNSSFCGYVYSLFHFLIHYHNILQMIILDLEAIFEGLDESVAILPKDDPRRQAVQMECNKTFERIVTWHVSVFKAMKTISSVYRPSLVYQLTVSSVAICLIAYQLAEKLKNNHLDVMFMLMGIAAITQLWIPCYLGTILRNKGFEVASACWGCGWERSQLGRMLRTELALVLLHAQQPINIKYTGLPYVELETFSAILSTSYTYFNMLRQSSN